MYMSRRIYRDFSKRKGSRVGWDKSMLSYSQNTLFGFTGWRGEGFNWYIVKSDAVQHLNSRRWAK